MTCVLQAPGSRFEKEDDHAKLDKTAHHSARV